jgi:hypothetical protein
MLFIACFICACVSGNCLVKLNCLVQSKLPGTGASRLQPVGQIQPASVFVNKAVWGHAHAYSSVYCLYCLCIVVFHITNAELGSYNRELKYLLSHFVEKKFANSFSRPYNVVFKQFKINPIFL